MWILPHGANPRASVPISAPPPIRRTVLVVLDGLRPDAITRFDLPTLRGLVPRSASTLAARTVSPSVTNAAMASLLTGVRPAVHGLTCDRFRMPARRDHLRPLPALLAEVGHPTRTWMARIPLPFTPLAVRLAGVLGILARFRGDDALEIAADAAPTLRDEDGLILLHLPDADRAGHAEGWMGGAYRRAAERLDAALAEVIRHAGVWHYPGTLLVVVADHGGGGATATDHDSGHRLDRTIPVLLAGHAVAPTALLDPVSLLDVPATIAWAMGAEVPEAWEGRVLVEGFVPEPLPGRRPAARVSLRGE